MPSLDSTKALNAKAAPILTACSGRHLGFDVFNACEKCRELWEIRYQRLSRCLLGNVGGSVCPNKIILGKIFFFFTNKGKGIAAKTSKKKRLDLEISKEQSETNPVTNSYELPTVVNPDPHY